VSAPEPACQRDVREDITSKPRRRYDHDPRYDIVCACRFRSERGAGSESASDIELHAGHVVGTSDITRGITVTGADKSVTDAANS
jgi:hypothetical protein